jgi:NADH-quinone oxidoreductase subunit F
VDNIETLLNDGYKAVLIAVGAHKNRKLGIPGEETSGVIDPLTLLRKVNLGEEVPPLGNRVGIVGGGNTAVDAARTALRLGSKDVFILYRRTRTEMPAIDEEIEAALDEGVKIEFLVAPKRIISEDGKLKAVEFIRMKLGKPDSSGRKRPIPVEGSEFTMELDSIIPAISQDPDLSLVPGEYDIVTPGENTLIVDRETYMTDIQGVFACGDAVTGPADVTTAMASARTAAESIHQYLRGEKVRREYRPIRPSVAVEPVEIEEDVLIFSRPEMEKLPPVDRINSFHEVELGYPMETAMKEARRCLRCDWDVQKQIEEREKEKAKFDEMEKAGGELTGQVLK